MLSIIYDKKEEKLNVDFDIPVPSTLDSDNLDSLLLGLTDIADAKLNRQNGALKGFSVHMRNWFKFIKHVLKTDDYVFQESILNDLIKQDLYVQGEGLQVNFHQKMFDTPGRYWSFILNQGNFIDFFFNRLNWYIGPKNAIVTPFPLHVDLESASTCNMDCPMCYRSKLNETGQMDFDLFKKAVDECEANNVFSIRLSWRGETLTHPRIKEMIAYATGKIKNVSFLTNAFYIDADIIDCLISNKVSYISVSFDGINENYEAIRHPAKFKENYNRLAMLRDKKIERKSKYPQVRVCTIWPAIREDPDAYYKTMKKVSDYIVYNPYINFKGPMQIKPDFICQYPWERIVIAFNGKAQCCTGWNAADIILGNVKDNTIYEMWNSDLMNKIRDKHAECRRMEFNSCANCRHGSKGEPNIEISEIVERRF
jgi:radical SAM protein with 4Fe4S-binding SPASM domain